MGPGLVDDFIRNLLSVLFCPCTILAIPFCPYHFIRYHFVREPYKVYGIYNIRENNRLLSCVHLILFHAVVCGTFITNLAQPAMVYLWYYNVIMLLYTVA